MVLEKGTVVNSIYHFPADMTFFSTPEKLAIGGLPFACPDQKPSRRQAVAYYRAVSEHFALPVRTGRTVTAARRDGAGFVLTVQHRAAEHTLRCEALVVATGFFDTPRRLGVPGEELAKCSHYFHDGHPYYGRRVAVVGGGNSAAETALELLRAGHKRSNAETAMHMIKTKFGAYVRAKTPESQVNEALVKVLAHNIVVLISSIFELGIEPVFNEAVTTFATESASVAKVME